MTDLGELRVLAEEAIAGVDGLDVGDLGRRDDRGDVQVAVCGGCWADADRLISEAQVQAVFVGLAVNRDRLDAQVLAGAQDPERDLAAIGDQDALEHVAP